MLIHTRLVYLTNTSMQWKIIKLYKNEEDFQEEISRSEFEGMLLSEKQQKKHGIKDSIVLVFAKRNTESINQN